MKVELMYDEDNKPYAIRLFVETVEEEVFCHMAYPEDENSLRPLYYEHKKMLFIPVFLESCPHLRGKEISIDFHGKESEKEIIKICRDCYTYLKRDDKKDDARKSN